MNILTKVALPALTLFAMVSTANALSFEGTDWSYSQNSRLVITLNPAFGGGIQNIPDSVVNQPKTVNQTAFNKFDFPLTIGSIPGTGDFTVTGLAVRDTNNAGTTPWQVVNGITLRAVYPTFNVDGLITGTNSNPLYDDPIYGNRVYSITGTPTSVTGIVIQAQTMFGAVTAGSAVAHLDSWNLSRSPVPEPGTMLIIAAGLAGLAKRRKG